MSTPTTSEPNTTRRLTLIISEDTIRAAKAEAAMQDKSVSKLTGDLLEKEITEGPSRREGKGDKTHA